MTRDEARAILRLPEKEAIDIILFLAEKASLCDQMNRKPHPSTPSGQIPAYLKKPGKKKKRKPGRKKGHAPAWRKKPSPIDARETHTLKNCPTCHTPVNGPVTSYTRCTEEIPPVNPIVTEHTIHGYWCKKCGKIMYPIITDALPGAKIGLRLAVFTAWLHYALGVSVSNIIKILNTFRNFKISAGGLTLMWKNLAVLLQSSYDEIGAKVAHSAVLHADETGWRINGDTHWLWCFANKLYCYYTITKSRGSPVVKKVLGTVFNGILICDFYGAYNFLNALAKQRCFYHLFTELRKVDVRNHSVCWRAFRKQLSRLMKDALRLWTKKESMSEDDFSRLLLFLGKRLDTMIDEHHVDKDAKRIVKRLKRHRNELFTFLSYSEVSPFNNHAEQQMRKPVQSRKISQQNRSMDAAHTQAVFMTLFRSAELHGLNPVETVLNLSKILLVKQDSIDNYLKLSA